MKIQIKNILTWVLLGFSLGNSMVYSTAKVYYANKIINNNIFGLEYIEKLTIHKILGGVIAHNDVVLQGGGKQTIESLIILVKGTGDKDTATLATLKSLTGEQYIEILSRLIVVTNIKTLFPDMDKTKSPEVMIDDLMKNVKNEFVFTKPGIFKLATQSPLLDKVLAANTKLNGWMQAVNNSNQMKSDSGIQTEVITSEAGELIAEAQSQQLTKNILLLNNLMGAAFDLVKDTQNNKYVTPKLLDISKGVYYLDDNTDMSGIKLVDKTEYDNKPAQQPGATTNADIIKVLANPKAIADLKQDAQTSLDALKAKANKSAAENDQIKALEELLVKANNQNNNDPNNTALNSSNIVDALQDKAMAQSVKDALKTKIDELNAKANKTDDENKQLDAMKLLYSSVEAGAKITYWKMITDGSTGDKVSFVGVPVVSGIFVFIGVKFFNKENEEPKDMVTESQSSTEA